MPVGLYSQPQARNAYQAAYENPYAAHGQPKAASKPLQVDCGWKTSSVVSISEQGRQSAGIQTVEPKVLSAAEEAVYVEQLKNAYMEQCVSPAYNKHGYNYRSPSRVENDIRQHDREATDWAYKKINAPEPCQTFELSMKKENNQDNIVSDVSTGMSWFGISMKSFSEYYQRHGDPYTVKIKEVSWQYTDYTNGAEKQNVELLYAEPYDPDQITNRKNWKDISEKSVGETPEFNHLKFGPGASFMIKFRLEGGYYPAKAPNTPATISVKYQYQTKSCHNPSMPRYHHDDL